MHLHRFLLRELGNWENQEKQPHPRGHPDQPDTALKFALFVTNNENQLGFAANVVYCPSTLTATLRRFLPMLPQ